MIDIQIIRDDPERVRQGMRDKGYTSVDVVDHLLALDVERRERLTTLHEAQARANAISKEIGGLMRESRKEEAESLKAETGRLKEMIRALEEEARTTDAQQEQLLLDVPNLAHPSVPVGRTAADNRLVHEEGEHPAFDFTPLPHWELAARHGLIDFERGAKVTGAGFPFYLGRGARLQRALVNFFLDQAAARGYTEVEAPFLVNEASARGTGQLPDKEGQMYEATADHLFLVPTAEVPLTNYFRDEILEEADLPVRFCGYTPCFRREAGSYGKDVRGLNRVHQFDKVELVRIVHPDRSYEALEELREDAENVLRLLGLPYRRMLMCTGDMGFTQTKQYDLEVWCAGQERWLEVSSVSNFETFQARRAAIRYRPAEGRKPALVHTLNGSALALPRIVATLLENNQQADGTIVVPEVLRSYTGFDRIG